MEWLFYQYISNTVSPFNSCLRKTSECWIEIQACWSNLSSNIFCCLIRQMTLRRLRDHRINLITAGVRLWSDFSNHVKGLRDAVSLNHVQSSASFFLWERSQQIWRKPNRPEVLTCHLARLTSVDSFFPPSVYQKLLFLFLLQLLPLAPTHLIIWFCFCRSSQTATKFKVKPRPELRAAHLNHYLLTTSAGTDYARSCLA